MKNFNSNYEASMSFMTWLHTGSRKFIGAYGTTPYYFMKNELKDGVVEVFSVGDFYSYDSECLPKYNPERRVLVGYYLLQERTFVSLEKMELRRDILDQIKTVSLEAYKKDLYYKVFNLMKEEARKVSKKTEDSWVNLDKES